jgi:general secretion pathway protein G
MVRIVEKTAGGNRTPSSRADPEAGWTYMETIIVLAIVIILTATVGFVFLRYVGTAKVVAARTQIETFDLALAQYYMDCGDYPSQDQGLDALYRKPSGGESLEKWDGPYLKKAVPLDPWGRPYAYQKPGPEGAEYGVASLGADGLEGGTGKNADITSWSQDSGK